MNPVDKISEPIKLIFWWDEMDRKDTVRKYNGVLSAMQKNTSGEGR